MSWYRRSSAPGLKSGRRRSSANHVAAGRRCSLSTFSATSRVRSSSKGYVGRDLAEDDIELCQPPIEEMPKIVGYENVTFEPYAVPPPALPIITEVDAEEQDDETYIKPFTRKILSEKDLRDILTRHADSRCSNDKNAARDMKITNVEYQPGFKYNLETFAETRQVCWNFEPYTGGHLDEHSATAPVPPDPWSIECSIPQKFQVNSLILDVPHTDVVMTCHSCGGVGSKRCTACSAVGWERCSFCFGDGQKISLQGHKERCFRCLGTGRKKCWKCNGDTIATCIGCGGTGQIRCFIAITISWNNHSDVHIIEPPNAEIIEEKLEYADGQVVFHEEKPLVSPIQIPDSDLQLVSTSLIEKHHSLSNENIILQRQTVHSIPIYCVDYEWKQKPGRFFVYGCKKQVFALDYPQKLCCCVLS